MKALVWLAIAAGVLVAPARTAVQTVDLPALDRTKIAFQLDAQPTTVIGPAQAPNGYFRTPNRTVRFNDGRIAFSTPWGFTRLHVVDASGKVTAIGNFSAGVMQGSLQDICRTSDDRLLVSHSRTQFTVFGPAGTAESSGALPGEMTLLCPTAASSGWARVTVPGTELRSGIETPHDPGVTMRRAKVRLQLLDLRGTSSVVADLGEFDAGEYSPTGPMARMQGANRPPLYGWKRRPFGRDLAAAPDGPKIHVGDGTTFEVRTWDSAGKIVRVLRVAGPRDPVTTDLRASYLEQEFAGNSQAYRDRTIAAFRYADASTFPSEVPAFSELRADRSGRLWVRRYPRPLEKTQEWWVFTADAQYLGRVDMPAAFLVDDIGDDYIAGSYLLRRAAQPESDAIMDQSDYDVRVYRLRRG